MSPSTVDAFLTALAFAAALFSALMFYLASPHCRWQRFRIASRFGNIVGSALAIASLAIWITRLGVAAGLCAMLASWMLGMIATPYLALLTTRTPTTENR